MSQQRSCALILTVLPVLLCAATAPRLSQTIAINGEAPGRLYEGLGAVSAGASSRLLVDYPEPYRSQILDYLFKPGFGAALQHLKVEIGGDTNSTDGSEPSFAHSRAEMAHPDFSRGYEWWLMKEARKRNPKILLEGLAWGAPGWIGNGEFFSPDMVDYLLRFIDGARKPYKLDLDYLGVWNEMRYDVPWLKSMKQALLKHSPRTKLVCCDLVPSQDQWSIVSAMLKDHELKDAIAAVTAHYTEIDTPGTAPIVSPQAARDAGRPLWASEDHPARNFWRDPHENDWPRGSLLAKLYNENYIERRFTKTEPWAVITSYYDILPAPNSGLMYASAPWSGNYRVQSTISATAHTTQFAQPGWRYIDSACGYLNGKGSYVTLRSAAKDWTALLSRRSRRRKLRLSRSNWHLSPSRRFTCGAPMRGARSNASPTSLRGPGRSYRPRARLHLFLDHHHGPGQRKRRTPADSAFPLPYREDFEKTTLGQSPRYLSDQNGAFEVVAAQGRPGRCLRAGRYAGAYLVAQDPAHLEPAYDFR